MIPKKVDSYTFQTQDTHCENKNIWLRIWHLSDSRDTVSLWKVSIDSFDAFFLYTIRVVELFCTNKSIHLLVKYPERMPDIFEVFFLPIQIRSGMHLIIFIRQATIESLAVNFLTLELDSIFVLIFCFFSPPPFSPLVLLYHIFLFRFTFIHYFPVQRKTEHTQCIAHASQKKTQWKRPSSEKIERIGRHRWSRQQIEQNKRCQFQWNLEILSTPLWCFLL